jgi:hypothetical protein
MIIYKNIGRDDMGKNLLSIPESVTSAIKNKRANIHLVTT